MQQNLKERIKELRATIDSSHNVLKVLNPKNVLERGYGYLEVENGKVVGSAQDFDKVSKTVSMNLHFHDGKRKVKSNES